MMEKMKITRENYEAYYLDALDGTLSTEEHALLQKFLEDDPELAIDMEGFPQLKPIDKRELPSNFIYSLKQVDLANEQIADENAEQFCIAASEGILTTQKYTELQKFVQKNESWAKVFQTCAQTKLQPRNTEVYPNSAELKRRERKLLPLFFTAAAAASFVIAFLVYQFNGNVTRNSSGQTFANHQQDSTKLTKKNKGIGPSQADVFPQDMQLTPQKTRNELDALVPDKNSFEPPVHVELAPILSQQKIDNTPEEDGYIAGYLPQAPNANTYVVPVRVNMPSDKANDLVNPIFPVTNALSAMLNTEIDFGKTRNTVVDKRGFFIKIGKFEISRNASRSSR
jgi:hypothetical protein